MHRDREESSDENSATVDEEWSAASRDGRFWDQTERLFEDEEPGPYEGQRFGLDRYCRYEMIDGQRRAIEPWPYWKPLPSAAYRKLTARYYLVRWHVGIFRQYGLKLWWEIRFY
jgi:hypothetical protein